MTVHVYKVAAWDGKDAYSEFAGRRTYFPTTPGATIDGGRKGLHTSRDRRFVLDYYTGLYDDDDILLKIAVEPEDIVSEEGSEVVISEGVLVDATVVRDNPLLALPPTPAGRAHRLGELVEAEVLDFFDYPADENLYEGVHVTKHPIVASAYALARRQLDYDDYGRFDVVDPAVLIGLRVEDPTDMLADADVLTTGKAIYDVALRAVDQDLDPEDLNDEETAEDLWLSDYSWGPSWAFESYLGLQYAGGDFGNRPAYDDFVEAVQTLMKAALDGKQRYALRAMAKKLALKIVPQSRLLYDVEEDQVAAVVVLAPYKPSEDDPYYEETVGFIPLDDFEYLETPEAFDDVLLADAATVVGDVDDVDQWHGTSLSIAAKAFPDLFPPNVLEEALEAGRVHEEPEYDEDEEYD
jgi:hypothetical protein